MLSEECMNEYRKQYPDEMCIYSASSGRMMIGNGEKAVFEPIGESDEVFFNRLERSIKFNKNLFYEEWEPFDYKEGCYY